MTADGRETGAPAPAGPESLDHVAGEGLPQHPAVTPYRRLALAVVLMSSSTVRVRDLHLCRVVIVLVVAARGHAAVVFSVTLSVMPVVSLAPRIPSRCWSCSSSRSSWPSTSRLGRTRYGPDRPDRAADERRPRFDEDATAGLLHQPHPPRQVPQPRVLRPTHNREEQLPRNHDHDRRCSLPTRLDLLLVECVTRHDKIVRPRIGRSVSVATAMLLYAAHLRGSGCRQPEPLCVVSRSVR
jgi:hypothetical protein